MCEKEKNEWMKKINKKKVDLSLFIVRFCVTILIFIYYIYIFLSSTVLVGSESEDREKRETKKKACELRAKTVGLFHSL